MSSKVCFVVLLACFAYQPANADDGIAVDKSTVEAAYLYNFALYTEWPEAPADVFRICVLGNDPVLAALEPVKNKQLKNHPVSVTSISPDAPVNTCQVLFVSRLAHSSIGNLSKKIGSAPVLVISEENGFDPRNVTIIIFEQQGRLAFRINRTLAEANSLTFSSKLLKLAQQVY